MDILYRVIVMIFIVIPGDFIAEKIETFCEWLEKKCNRFRRWSHCFYYNIK
jgi:hypothetical protein